MTQSRFPAVRPELAIRLLRGPRRWGLGAVAALLVSAAGAHPAAATGAPERLEYRFAPTDLAWEPVADAVRPLLPRGVPSGAAGSFDLPLLVEPVVPPAGRRLASAVVERVVWIPVSPPGPLATVRGRGEIDPGPPRDPLAAPAALGLGGYARGVRRDAVLISPLRTTSDGGLELVSELVVRLSYESDPSRPDVDPAARDRALPPAAEIRRPDADRSRVALPASWDSGGRLRPDFDGRHVSLVIVTSESLAPEFERLAEWRNRSGVPSVIRTVEWVESEYEEGVDPEERIRIFLREAVNHWGVESVLIGGDTPIVPARYGRTTWFLGEDIPTDLYYQCLDGSWNGNGNDLFGEGRRDAARLGDGVDLLPDVWIGRMSVQTPEQARTVIDKVLRYEIEPPVDADYPASALFLAEVLFPQNWDGVGDIVFDGAVLAETAHAKLPASFVTRRLYENHVPFAGALPETLPVVIEEINRGYGLVNHVGHGFHNNMAVGLGGRSIFIPDVDEFTNGDRASFLYAINCTSAGIDFDAIAEHWLTNPRGGAFACIGSTRFDFPATSQVYDAEFYRLVFEAGVDRIGEAHTESKLPFIPLSQSDNAHRWTQFTLTYLGDPNTRLWTAAPTAISATHPATLPLDAGGITVTLLADAAPLEGARVTLYRKDEVFAIGETGQDGAVTLPFLADGPGPIAVTATARNRLPYRGEVSISETAAGVPVLAGVSADGAPGTESNGNGLLEAGERATVLIDLRNRGGASLAGIAVDAVSESPDVSASGPATGPSALSPGQVGRYAVEVGVRDGISGSAAGALSLTVTAATGTWPLRVPLAMGVPELRLDELRIRVTAGSDNGIYDPGDEIEITPVLLNRGTGATRPLTASITPAAATASTVLVGTAAFGEVAAGESGPADGFAPLKVRIGTGPPPEFILSVSSASVELFRRRIDLVRPEFPLSVEARGEPSGIRVTWSASASPDLMRYVVYRSDAEEGPFVRVSGVEEYPQGVFVDGPLPPLAVQYYRVAAQDSSGNLSPRSVVARGTTTLPLASGFPIESSIGTTGSPLAADLDGDGRLEIVNSGDQIYVVHTDGTELRDGDRDARTLGPWTGESVGNGFWAAPAVGDLDGDGRLEVVAVSMLEGKVFVWDAAGRLLPGWPQSDVVPGGGSAALSAPTLADLDGDGSLEIVLHAETSLYAWDRFGEEVRDGDANPLTKGIFYQTGSGDSYASVAAEDLDDDGAAEVIAATRAARLFVVRGDGTPLPGFPIRFGHDDRFAPLISSPAVADLDGDGSMEILLGTGADSLEVIRADGTKLPGWPQNLLMNQDIMSSPAVADVDGDGVLEVSAVSGNNTVYLWKANGDAMPGFPRKFTDSLFRTFVARGSPVMGNVDDDDDLEIIWGNQDGWLYGVNPDGELAEGFPIKTGGSIEGAALIDDLDGDGLNEIAVSGFDRNLYLFRTPGHVVDRPGWKMFQHDPRRTGSRRTATDEARAPVLHVGILQTPQLPGSVSCYAVSARSLAAPPTIRLDGGALPVETIDAARRLYRSATTLTPGTHVLRVEATSVDGYAGSTERRFDAVAPLAGAGWIDAPAAGVRLRFDRGPAAGIVLAWRVEGGAEIPGTERPPGPGPLWMIGEDGAPAPSGTRVTIPRPEGWTSASLERWDGSAWRALPGRSVEGWIDAALDRYGWIRMSARAPVSGTLRALAVAPNPFSAAAAISFVLDGPAEVLVDVFDARGARVARLLAGELSGGEHRAAWDGRGEDGRPAAGGIYFVRAAAGGSVVTRKIVRLDAGGDR